MCNALELRGERRRWGGLCGRTRTQEAILIMGSEAHTARCRKLARANDAEHQGKSPEQEYSPLGRPPSLEENLRQRGTWHNHWQLHQAINDTKRILMRLRKVKIICTWHIFRIKPCLIISGATRAHPNVWLCTGTTRSDDDSFGLIDTAHYDIIAWSSSSPSRASPHLDRIRRSRATPSQRYICRASFSLRPPGLTASNVFVPFIGIPGIILAARGRGNVLRAPPPAARCTQWPRWSPRCALPAKRGPATRAQVSMALQFASPRAWTPIMYWLSLAMSPLLEPFETTSPPPSGRIRLARVGTTSHCLTCCPWYNFLDADARWTVGAES
ncbi:hypothetical protein FB451DRAFT_1187918 [Mycena latifolia]|nr:hypothetical protein FB451DRAFT_1187918 [Mycena latifolia]